MSKRAIFATLIFTPFIGLGMSHAEAAAGAPAGIYCVGTVPLTPFFGVLANGTSSGVAAYCSADWVSLRSNTIGAGQTMHVRYLDRSASADVACTVYFQKPDGSIVAASPTVSSSGASDAVRTLDLRTNVAYSRTDTSPYLLCVIPGTYNGAVSGLHSYYLDVVNE